MDKMIVVSLVTDRGDRKTEFGALGQKLTGSATNPQYVIRNPFDDKVLDIVDYNQAKNAALSSRLERGIRRFNRTLSRFVQTEAKR